MRLKVDKRTRARELAMQAIYQLDVQGPELLNRLGFFFLTSEPEDIEIRKLADKWTRQTWENLQACDEMIESSTLKWGLARLSFVDKSILRLSVYQLKFCVDIPAKVVINEGIELAKKFSAEQSPSFVNGVLDAVLNKLKEQK